eukprot:2111809-Prymnesium_polylepis.1
MLNRELHGLEASVEKEKANAVSRQWPFPSQAACAPLPSRAPKPSRGAATIPFCHDLGRERSKCPSPPHPPRSSGA